MVLVRSLHYRLYAVNIFEIVVSPQSSVVGCTVNRKQWAVRGDEEEIFKAPWWSVNEPPVVGYVAGGRVRCWTEWREEI